MGERVIMNREILFKAKRIDNGEWVEGYLFDDGMPEPKHYFIGGIIVKPYEGTACDKWNVVGIDFCEIDINTLCQYTGLTDKNDKKIWENDILKFNDEIWYSCYTSCGTEYDSWEAENYGVVGYCDYSARYDFTKYKYNENQVEADLHKNHDIEFSEFVKEHEVIGNIFDNPELVEVE